MAVGVEETFAMLFWMLADSAGLRRAYSKFEILMANRGVSTLITIENVYKGAAAQLPCDAPLARVEPAWQADMAEVRVMFSSRRRIGYQDLREVPLDRNMFRDRI
jgi:hypothetical protein